MTKVTIFHLIQSNEVGGGMENIFLEYSKILNINGFNLICLVSDKFCHIKELEKNNIKIEPFNISGHFDILAAIKLRYLIKQYSPNLIMANNGRNFSVINICKLFFGLKNAKTLAISHGGSVKRIVNFNYAITVASHIYDQLLKKGFKGKVVNIHNGCKIITFGKTTQNKNFTFGVLSRLSTEKNVAAAIISFKKFNDEIDQNSILIIGGEGKELENLKLLAKKFDLENNIKFIGWVKDKGEFFNQIDVFLQPALAEPFGITILESFNYKTPVIAANSFGPKEIIQHQLNGYLFDSNQENSLFLMMKKSYLEKENSINLANQATKDLQEKFSDKIMEQKLLDFIKKISYNS